MPASEAQILANRRNSAKSTGPKTEEGKARSPGNALKHGLTGDGVVLLEEDAAEVERMAGAFEEEMRPSGEMGRLLLRRVATLAVRMERSVAQESAALAERVRLAQDEAGEDPSERSEAGRRAMFDPSREACLARQYEAAAERGMYRALKEFRDVERAARMPAAPATELATRPELASFSRAEAPAPAVAKPPVATSKPAPPPASNPPRAASTTRVSTRDLGFEGISYVPIAIGRPGGR